MDGRGARVTEDCNAGRTSGFCPKGSEPCCVEHLGRLASGARGAIPVHGLVFRQGKIEQCSKGQVDENQSGGFPLFRSSVVLLLWVWDLVKRLASCSRMRFIPLLVLAVSRTWVERARGRVLVVKRACPCRRLKRRGPVGQHDPSDRCRTRSIRNALVVYRALVSSATSLETCFRSTAFGLCSVFRVTAFLRL